MQQAVYDTRGADPHTRIHCIERDTPAPGAGEVLVEMIAAPINPSDIGLLTGAAVTHGPVAPPCGDRGDGWSAVRVPPRGLRPQADGVPGRRDVCRWRGGL